MPVSRTFPSVHRVRDGFGAYRCWLFGAPCSSFELLSKAAGILFDRAVATSKIRSDFSRDDVVRAGVGTCYRQKQLRRFTNEATARIAVLVMSKGALSAKQAQSYYEEKYAHDDYGVRGPRREDRRDRHPPRP
jgi:hypothetical protein